MAESNRVRRPRWRKRLIMCGLIAIGLAATAIVALPFALESKAVRVILLARANRAIAPSTLDIGRFRFSWFEPTRFDRFELKDDQGNSLISAPSVILRRNLAQIVFQRSSIGTIELIQPRVQIKRRADGSVNLLDTLARTSAKKTHIDITDGSLVVESPEFSGPLTAASFLGTIDRPDEPGPLSWFLHLVQTNEPGSPSLTIQGRLDREFRVGEIPPSFGVDLSTSQWPFAFNTNQGPGRVTSTGNMVLQRRPGGDMELLGRVAFSNFDAPGIDLKLGAEPVTFRCMMKLAAKDDQLTVAIFEFHGLNISASLEGSVERFQTDRVAHLKGTIEPDWDSLIRDYANPIDPNAEFEIGPARLRVEGSLANGLDELEAELAVRIESARFQGLRLGPTQIVARARGGKYSIDPIHATLNDGKLMLVPDIQTLETGQGKRERVLALDSRSSLQGASIDDVLSQRVLSFVAPVLADATRVGGTISVAVNEAQVPLGRDSQTKARFEGTVQFNDVSFAPGPLALQLFQAAGIDRPPVLKLEAPVTFEVADGRVEQHGLAIPLGKITKIELAGWVDFDKNMALDASLPFTPQMMGGIPLLSAIAEGARITVPIRGTLGHAKIDPDLFKANMKEMGRGLAERGTMVGIGSLLKLLTQPKNQGDRDFPPVPQPPRQTPEERKAEQLLKREERRAEQDRKKAERQERRKLRREGKDGGP